jgi:hypothetical protein
VYLKGVRFERNPNTSAETNLFEPKKRNGILFFKLKTFIQDISRSKNLFIFLCGCEDNSREHEKHIALLQI